MALVDSGRAMGAVTRLLQERLTAAMQGLAAPQVPIDDVTIGKPEPPAGIQARRRLNLFLYEVEFDGHLRNLSLDEGQPPPVWLVLHYLLTAFDHDGLSDSIEAHEILGEGIRVLQDLNFFSLTGLPVTTVTALSDLPDQLKLAFEDASSDLLSKIMSGSDESYRCSVAFQVRPVMIASEEPPHYSLLVGVDYTTGTVPGEDAIHVPVLPSLGPSITEVSPQEFETAQSGEVLGTELQSSGLSVRFGPVELPVISQRPDRLGFQLSQSLENGEQISAGSHALEVVQHLPTGRVRRSNPLIVGLLPRLDAALPSGLARVTPADPASPVTGFITLSGVLLGTPEDEVYLGLQRNGSIARLYDDFQAPLMPGSIPQTELVFPIETEKAVLPGEYRAILRVNGRQARNSPPIMLVAP